jgi:hypothetical protein
MPVSVREDTIPDIDAIGPLDGRNSCPSFAGSASQTSEQGVADRGERGRLSRLVGAVHDAHRRVAGEVEHSVSRYPRGAPLQFGGQSRHPPHS